MTVYQGEKRKKDRKKERNMCFNAMSNLVLQVWFKNRRAKYRKKQRAIKSKTKDPSGNTSSNNTTTNNNNNSSTTSSTTTTTTTTTTKPSTDTTTSKSTSASTSEAAENISLEEGSSAGSTSSPKRDGAREDSKGHFRSPTSESEDSAMESDNGEDNSSAVDVESLDAGADTERGEKRVECDSASEATEHTTTKREESADGRFDDSQKSASRKDHNSKFRLD